MHESNVKVRVGVVGVGSIATYMHLPALRGIDAVQIVALCDRNEYLLERSGEKYGVKSLYEDYKDMLAAEVLDAVILCLPPMFHSDAVDFFITNSVHVFCEKPVGMDSQALKRLLKQAEEKSLVLHAGYHNRFIKTFTDARDLVESGKLGRLLQFNLTATLGGPNISWEPKSGWYHSRAGGGVTFDAGSHMLDLLHYLTGLRVAEASVCATTTDPNNELPDQVAVCVKTSEGVIGTVNIGWGGKTAIQAVTLYGTSGHIIVTPTALTFRSSKHNKITDFFDYLGSAYRLARGIVSMKIKSGPPPQYQEQMERFIEAVRPPSSEKELMLLDSNAFVVLSALDIIQSQVMDEACNDGGK